MEAPFVSLALLFVAPLLAVLAPWAALAVTAAGGVAAVLADGAPAGLTAAAIAAAAALLLHLARRRGAPAVWLLAGWLVLCLAPRWGPALTQRLASATTANPPAAAWALWPPAPLASERWDPARLPSLYEEWGSRTAVPVVPAAYPLVLLAAGCAALYFLPARRRNGRPAADTGP